MLFYLGHNAMSSRNKDEYILPVGTVLSTLGKAGVKLISEKCKLLEKE